MADLIKTTFEDYLRVEGVNYMGFGVLPKFAMLDTDLSIEAKAIYAYFCSYAGNGSTAFPGRERILSDLGVNKDTYYRHFHLLTLNGYITVEQKRVRGKEFSKNIYTIASNPKKYEDSLEDNADSNELQRLRFSGIKALGYGVIPKAVMLDERLSIKSKGLYAYFCSFTGSGNSAFPTRDTIFYHLGMSENTYYKHYRLLTKLNYLTVVQRRVDGKVSVNDYYLQDTPDSDKAITNRYIPEFSPYLNSSDTIKSDTIISDTILPDTIKSDTKFSDTNINNLNKNNLIKNSNNNPSLSHDKSSLKQNEKMSEREILSDNDLYLQVIENLLTEKQIPFWYYSDERLITAAIHFMTEWDTFHKDGFEHELDQAVYELFNTALVEMCQTPEMTLKGAFVTCEHVIRKINEIANFQDAFVDISEFMDVALENYKNALKATDIKNPVAYMKSCIWDAMKTGKIKEKAIIERDFGPYRQNQ